MLNIYVMVPMFANKFTLTDDSACDQRIDTVSFTLKTTRNDLGVTSIVMIM